ncbi:MAG: DUF4251 domain-containing protein [Sphingobacteriales bacterium]
MKTLKKILILLLIVSAGLSAANAQTAKKDKRAAKAAAIKSDIESKRYTFIANEMIPQGGGSKQLDYGYDVRVTTDSVISFLPYFGRAYFDVPYNPTDGGIKFTSTNFDYKVAERKKGGWEITIKPKDVKNLTSMVLSVSSNGYASLTVTSFNRDFITFYGNLEERGRNLAEVPPVSPVKTQ